MRPEQIIFFMKRVAVFLPDNFTYQGNNPANLPVLRYREGKPGLADYQLCSPGRSFRVSPYFLYRFLF
jgi:hypothetical protein